MMLKEMMNTRQAVKSVEGYNTLSRREQDKIAGESGLLICWIFGPMLLLIPLYFLLPEAWFENCLGSATFLSIAGLFVGLYQVEKNRQIQDEGSAIGAALVFFFVVFGFGCLWQVQFPSCDCICGCTDLVCKGVYNRSRQIQQVHKRSKREVYRVLLPVSENQVS